mgnify:CR=1 FL=1
MDRDDPTIRWLLESRGPSIRYFTLIELLDQPANLKEVRLTRSKIPEGARFRALLRGQRLRDDLPQRKRPSDELAELKFSIGGFCVHPYRKWTGAHWRLVSLVEQGVQPDHPQALAAAQQVLRWLWGKSHRQSIRRIKGLIRRCASQEGNALAVYSRLGMIWDERVSGLAASLVEWQWPDGGWDCDKRPKAHHSSFYESLAPLWGLVEYYRATGNVDSLNAAERAAEFFVRHRLFRRESTGEVIDSEWLRLHYPLYWHYDILQALRILAMLGKLRDQRAQEALDIVERKRGPDGKWRVEGCYWMPKGRRGSNEVLDWGRDGPNEMITLNALRVGCPLCQHAGKPRKLGLTVSTPSEAQDGPLLEFRELYLSMAFP